MSTVHLDDRLARAVELREIGRTEAARQLLSDTTGADDILAYKAAVDTYADDLDRTWR
ncbi:MAG TPA: hypothetical protein VMP13_03690 [Acidimicrobiia bacterium]|nr:hypothetical protein [Acidimicrobiia bacterium]